MRRTGRISGLVSFFVGIALLLATFILAAMAFADPDRLARFTNLIPYSGGDYEGLVKAVGYLIAIGLLLVMVLVGALVTRRGLEMYEAKPPDDSHEKV